MTEPKKLWDKMAEARYRAVAANEKMLHWRVNHAAILTLMADERASQIDLRQRFEEQPFFGVGFKIDQDDRNDSPNFKLVTEQSRDRRP